jgi:hypothetical protein
MMTGELLDIIIVDLLTESRVEGVAKNALDYDFQTVVVTTKGGQRFFITVAQIFEVPR